MFTQALISATGTHTAPYTPIVANAELFQGDQVHSSSYYCASRFAGKVSQSVSHHITSQQLLLL
jgi:cation diffusion facilitator CzcD-associated flavoprotein CzcO